MFGSYDGDGWQEMTFGIAWDKALRHFSESEYGVGGGKPLPKPIGGSRANALMRTIGLDKNIMRTYDTAICDADFCG